jgi:hypothetical protein
MICDDSPTENADFPFVKFHTTFFSWRVKHLILLCDKVVCDLHSQTFQATIPCKAKVINPRKVLLDITTLLV